MISHRMDNTTKHSSSSSLSSSFSAPRSHAKQSSCELNSRLKTRKLLGVGETNDGDVHRSKLSQILGHSEQLYFKEPRGLRFWQLFSSILFSILALSEFVHPGSVVRRSTWGADHQDKTVLDAVTPRLYAAALFSLSYQLWRSFLSLDRELIRVSLLSSALYSALHVSVCTLTWLPSLVSSSLSSSSSFLFLLSYASAVLSLEFVQLVAFAVFGGFCVFFYRLVPSN